MRIAFLGDGSLGHVRRWAGYFKDRGHDTLLLSFEDVSGVPVPARRLRAYLPTKMLGYLTALGRVRGEIDAFRPDIVNALYIGGYGLVAALCGHRPLVVSALGSDLLVDYPSSIIHRLQIDYAVRRADLVTTDADTLTEKVVAIGAPRERVLKTYFGVDERVFHPPEHDPSERTRAPMEIPRIVSTRNLYSVYNIDLIIDSARAILERIEARFVICGDGPQRVRLERKVERLGLSGAFVFRGRLAAPGIAEELRKASVYVSTSRSDSTSVSLLEAMASGAPPVVTDLDANREWITDGDNGLLVFSGDTASFAAAVVRMIEDRDFSDSVRAKNIDIVRERGLWTANMCRVEERFEELLARKTSER